MESRASVRPTVEDLYRAHRQRLLRLGFLLTSDRGAAEDATQEAFTSLAARFDEIGQPEAYLRQAVVNRINDGHRKASRRLRPEPVVQLEEPELDETWALVQELPPVQRAVVVLRFYEDLRLVDIATLLDRPESTVRSDLRRALLRLRTEMEA